MAKELALPEKAIQIIEEKSGLITWNEVEKYIINLTKSALAFEAWQQLKTYLKSIDDNTNMCELTVLMAAAAQSKERYRELGIGDDVFLPTMKCFARFLLETERKTGTICFDRGFWTWRQLSLRLFRLGTLEFEYCPQGMEKVPDYVEEKSPVISVHIPSDAKMTEEELKDSYNIAFGFFEIHGSAICDAGAPRAMLCTTWLLSPSLNSLLPENSGIRRFFSHYDIFSVDEDEKGFYEWLFGGCTELERLPETTSLQRRVKTFLMDGGKIGEASGSLKPGRC